MLDWIKNNKAGLTLTVLAVAVGVVMFSMSGCQMTDWVNVEVPRDVQKVVEVGPKVTLTEAPGVLEEYVASGEKMAVNIDDAYNRLGVISSLLTLGLESGASAFPGGAMIFGLLTGAGGLLMQKPGTDKEMSEREKASYNKGVKETKAVIAVVKSTVDIADV